MDTKHEGISKTLGAGSCRLGGFSSIRVLVTLPKEQLSEYTPALAVAPTVSKARRRQQNGVSENVNKC